LVKRNLNKAIIPFAKNKITLPNKVKTYTIPLKSYDRSLKIPLNIFTINLYNNTKIVLIPINTLIRRRYNKIIKKYNV
jgi:hypothetical protein